MPAKDSAVCTPPLKLFPSCNHKNLVARYILPLILLQTLAIKVAIAARV